MYSDVGTHEERLKVVRALAARANNVTIFSLNYPRDEPVPVEMENAIARYVCVSTTLKALSLVGGGFTDSMYHKIARSLCVNTSVYILNMAGNAVESQARIVNSFVHAVVVNPNRPPNSFWALFITYPGTDYAIVCQHAFARTKATLRKKI